MALTLATSARNAMADALVDLLDAGGAGTIQIRSGTRPATPNDAVTGTLLATVTLAAPAFGAASNGVTALTDPGPVTAAAGGTATWFRALSGGGAAVFDGTVATSGADLNLATTALTAGLTVDITGGSVTMPVA